MAKIIVLIQFIVIALSQNNDSIDCKKYFSKFGTKDFPLAFTGDAVYFSESKDVQINVKYTDTLFEDPLYFGLVQEDGKTPETTCLKLQVYHLNETQDQNPQQLSNLSIISSNNTINQWRYYQFKIPISQLNKELLIKNILINDIFIYYGFYSIIFESTTQDALKYELAFDFTITINNISQQMIDTEFKYHILLDQTNVIPPESKLFWCTDITCHSYLNESPTIRLNDIFVIQQIIDNVKFANQYLINTEVRYTSNFGNHKATIVYIDNTTPGQVILQLKAEISWAEINIIVTSTLFQYLYNNKVETIIPTSFQPLTQRGDHQCSENDTELKWCSDFTCQKFLDKIPNIHLNETFTLKLSNNCFSYVLSQTEVWYTGNGLYRKAKQVQILDNEKNEVYIQLKVEIVWNNVTINVAASHCQGKIQGSTDVIPCIKPEGKQTCASCEEQCRINGFSDDTCGICHGFLIFLNMILKQLILISSTYNLEFVSQDDIY